MNKQFLVLLESTAFYKHLNGEEIDSKLVDLVLGHYCKCILNYAKMRRNANWSNYIDGYRNEYFLEVAMNEGLGLPCIDDEGMVTNRQHRFLELFDLCLNTFTLDLVSTINDLRRTGKKISTVDVVGYDKYTFKIMVQTK